jgi:hypothetical protein
MKCDHLLWREPALGGNPVQVRPVVEDGDFDNAPWWMSGKGGEWEAIKQAGQRVRRRPQGGIKLEKQGTESRGCLDQPGKRMRGEVLLKQLGLKECGVVGRVWEADQQGAWAIGFDAEIHGCSRASVVG